MSNIYTRQSPRIFFDKVVGRPVNGSRIIAFNYFADNERVEYTGYSRLSVRTAKEDRMGEVSWKEFIPLGPKTPEALLRKRGEIRPYIHAVTIQEVAKIIGLPLPENYRLVQTMAVDTSLGRIFSSMDFPVPRMNSRVEIPFREYLDKSLELAREKGFTI